MVPSNSSVPGRTNRWKKEVSSNAPWMAGSRLLWEDGGLFWAYLSKLTRNILRWRRKRRKQYPDDPWCGNPNDINYPLKCVFLTCFWYHLNCRMVLFLFWISKVVIQIGKLWSCLGLVERLAWKPPLAVGEPKPQPPSPVTFRLELDDWYLPC